MDPARWRQIEQLFEDTRARPIGDRAAHLSVACGADEDLRREVETLLAQADSGDTFLEVPAFVPIHIATEHPSGGLVGRRIGPYEVVALVGVGGMGEVYRALDRSLGREVAVKVLPPSLTAEPSRRARFEREARMLASFAHPNIATIHGIESFDGQQALVMELVEGETLEARIARGPLTPSDVRAIAAQIADALDTAHERGIVHRDLKPANIKVTRDGRVKVLDFGLAKVAAGEASSSDLAHHTGATQTGTIVGTPRYMSPEQARGLAIDKRTDIWAFGCVLYEMLTGQVAFTGDTVADTIAAVLERDPDWEAMPASTLAAWRRLVRRCLEKEPARRLRDIGDARVELDDLPAVPEASVQVAPRRRRVGAIAAGGLLTAGVAGALVFYPSAPAPITTSESPLADAPFVQLTDFPGDEAEGMISRDGRFVAFLSNRAGPIDLWLTQPGTGRFVNLTPGPEDDRARDRASGIDNHGFTGDGSGVWMPGGLVKPLMIFPLLGGPPKPFLDERVNSVAWSPDGSALVYSTVEPGDPIFVAQANGEGRRQIHITTPGLHNHGPIWSLDGKWIYFLHGRAITFDLNVWRVPVAGGAAERVVSHAGGVTSVAPIGNASLLFTGRAPDFSGPWLWVADLATGAVRKVSSGTERYTSVSASGDGGLVVATAADPIEKLWTVPLHASGIRNGEEREYLTPSVRAVSPRFSRAGLLYVGGSANGWLLRHTGDAATEIWRDAGASMIEAPAVSRDGRRIAVVIGSEGRRRLAVMSADGTGLRRLAESLDVLGPVDWSPDGSAIVAGGIAAGHGQGLFKVTMDEAGSVSKLADGGAVGPIWSPTEDLIVFLGPNVAGHAALRGVRADGTAVPLPAVTAVFPGSSGLKDPYPRFTPDGRTIVFVQAGPTYVKRDFWALDLASGTTRQLSHFTSDHSIGGFDISPDGRTLVYGRANDNGNLVLIDLRRGR